MEATKLDYYEALYQRSPKYLRFYKNTVLPLIFLSYLFPIAWQILGRTISDDAFTQLCWVNGAWMLAVAICFVVSNWQHLTGWIINMAFCSIFSGTLLVSLIKQLIVNKGVSGFVEQVESLNNLDTIMSFIVTWIVIIIMLLGALAIIIALASHIWHAKLFLTPIEELRQEYEKQENP